MFAQRSIARFGATVLALGVLAGSASRGAPATEERNAWPVLVRQLDEAGETTSWTGAGPFLFGRETEDGGYASGFRPIWIQSRAPDGRLRAGYFVYPLFSYTADENTYKWSLMELIRRTDRRKAAGAPESIFDARGEFEVWPFYFSRQTGDPGMSYRAVFPVYGTIKNKLGFERASWVLFPLYFQTEKKGTTTTAVPWPFVRVTRGEAHGFGLWPLYEQRERTGAWRQVTYLWPLGFDSIRQPPADAPAGTSPRRDVGFLPFYSRHTGPGFVDENFGWPFFGYTHRTEPVPYHESRYFWPFLVQGRGPERYVNRWGPFYTHSVVKGYDKRWYLWPLLRRAEWTDEGLDREKTTLLYFLYWSESQRRAGTTEGPRGHLTHVWPLYSSWDNGAGRKQFQLFSPLEVFFPGNEKIRTAWTPLFAIARHEQTTPGVRRTSLLWNAITWRSDAAQDTREFHAGPLVSSRVHPGGKRIALGNGLVAFRRETGSGWKIRFLDFRSRSLPPANPPP